MSRKLKKIVTWNVNSIAVRKDQAVEFVKAHNPDYLCLQELKCTNDAFCFDAFHDLGYVCTVHGQKAYNGVAILSRETPSAVITSFPNQPLVEQARFLRCDFEGLTLTNLYVPNGQELGTDKYVFKLEWLKQLRAYLADTFDRSRPSAIVGDYNIALDHRDVYNEAMMKGRIHASTPEREALYDLMSVGYHDEWRIRNRDKKTFSWWDYRDQSVENNKGLRIDLILANLALSKQCQKISMDFSTRTVERPSDHIPVIGEYLL